MSERAMAAQPKDSTGPNANRSAMFQRQCACGTHCIAGGECEACRGQKQTVQRVSLASFERGHRERREVPSIVREVLGGPGQPLDTTSRAFFEPRFGHDFSQVRVHIGAKATESARTVNALAYTVGRNVVFGAEQYQPATTEGKLLLAHELTHVVQQHVGNAQVAHRQADESPAPSSAARQRETGATERLLAIIADIERVQANASRSPSDAGTQEGGQPGTNEHAEKIMVFLEQLRAAASGNDEELKLRVLAGFSSQGIRQAEATLAEDDTTVREHRPESLTAKTLELSHPGDAAEIEAERVAQAMVHGSGATVIQATPGGLVNRQAEALAGAGAAILTLEAESLPATSWNPPGWVLLGVATVVAAALIGTAVYMASNVADTGIMGEVQQLIEAAKAAGAALTICEALAQLMAAAKRANDSARVQKIKATQKAKGCRHSSYS